MRGAFKLYRVAKRGPHKQLNDFTGYDVYASAAFNPETDAVTWGRLTFGFRETGQHKLELDREAIQALRDQCDHWLNRGKVKA